MVERKVKYNLVVVKELRERIWVVVSVTHISLVLENGIMIRISVKSTGIVCKCVNVYLP